MSRKREKPYYTTRHVPYSYPKRRRPPPQPSPPPPEDLPQDKPTPPPPLLVLGLPKGCSILDLKARFEVYGSISRTRIDPSGVGSVSFRAKSDAEAAVVASLDPSFGISVDSHPVKVMWATEMNGAEAGDHGEGRERKNSSPNSNSSKLLKGEVPLSRHGRGNRLSSAIVNPNATNSDSYVLDPPYKPRQIVAYDDIL